ncbi:MAG: NAD(P)-dependent oxidoreductase [Fusobacteriaceae bacterium]|nr:NAD(P)-dependent oxidoreductase [Fusobacteriaceae bacterium]
MKIFFTGGTGFIGSHIVKKLKKERHDILLLVHENKLPESLVELSKDIKTINGNLSEMDSWKDDVINFKPEATLHMAWEGIPDYSYQTSINNLKYGLDLITLLSKSECKYFLSTGSCWEYGQKYGKLNEEMIPKPNNSFTAAKNSLHYLGREVAKENDMQFIWTRLFYVYGPGQKDHSLIPHIIKYVNEGKNPDIKTPFSRNDFVYVEDVATAISMILKKRCKSTIFNIGSGYSTKVQDIIKLIYDELGLPFNDNPSSYPNSESFIDFWADISKIKNEIGWKPKTNIHEGIKKMLSDIRR